MITKFSTSKAPKLRCLGGKGLNLIRMMQAGLPVPDGFVVETEAYREFVLGNSLDKQIETIVRNVSPDNMKALEKASQKIKKLFEKTAIPKNISQKILAAAKKLGSKAVAVRSSATAEDLPGMSFAGQHDTFLNVIGETELLKRVKDCWASLWNARAISYRLKQKISQKNQKLSLAVVVQQLVNSDKAGVMFTVNPVNGRRDQIFINSSWGLGEAVVSGIVTPDQFVLTKESGKVVEKTIAKKTVQVVRRKQGSIQKKVPRRQQQKISLSQSELKQLHDLALEVEAYYAEPMDTEWAVENGQAYLVQARPVTSLFPLPQPHEDPADEGLKIYLSMNRIAQGISDPFTPVGEELWRIAMWSTLKLFDNKADKYTKFFKVAAGRVYIDMTALIRNPKRWKMASGRLALKDPIASKTLVDFLKRNKKAITSRKSKLKIPPRLIGFYLKVLGAAISAIISPQKAEQKMEALTNERLAEIAIATKRARSIKAKLLTIENIMPGLIAVALLQCGYFVPGMSAEKIMSIKLKKWFGNDKLLASVIHALPNNPTTQMGKRLVEIACELKKQGKKPTPDHPLIQDFLQKFGHRANTEIDGGLPRWSEEPEYILNVINSYIEQDPGEMLEKLKQNEIKAQKAVLEIVRNVRKKKGPVRAWLVRKSLGLVRQLLGLREQPKFDIIRSFAWARGVLREIGAELKKQRKLKEVNDIYFLRFVDIRQGKNLKNIVERNKAEYVKNQEIKTIPRFIANTGECLYGVSQSQSGGGLTGVPISPGEYTGTVKVIEDPRGANLKKGEILVTHSTDPSWTPLFLNAGALIMETGGPISHGGIVAREYGIPAVAGIERVTEKLKTGDRVRVNGDNGAVVLVKK